MEFADHRPLYEWFIANLPTPSTPEQTEFARLNLTYTVLSKRRLNQLVTQNLVNGWDDPRMPTLRGLRRRGIPAESIRDFAQKVSVSRADSTVEYSFLEACVRERLNKSAERRMAVLRPLKVVITNYESGQSEMLEAVNNPEDATAGTRMVPFSRELYIERDDFMEEPPKKFFRLAPGREVRLRYAYYLTCNDVMKNEAGDITELHCTYDPATKGGDSPDGRKVKATMHWVSAQHAVSAEVRLYDHLFKDEFPSSGDDFLEAINPDSLTVTREAKLEPDLRDAEVGKAVQFERLGYFCLDSDSTDELPVFNRTVSLKDTWKKVQAKSGK